MDGINSKFLPHKHSHMKNYNKKRDFPKFSYVEICTIIKACPFTFSLQCLYSIKLIFFIFQVFEIESCLWVGEFWIGGLESQWSVGWMIGGQVISGWLVGCRFILLLGLGLSEPLLNARKESFVL